MVDIHGLLGVGLVHKVHLRMARRHQLHHSIFILLSGPPFLTRMVQKKILYKTHNVLVTVPASVINTTQSAPLTAKLILP